ncbi:MAG: hypothetical protein ABTQ73_09090 [Caldilineales bacterium]
MQTASQTSSRTRLIGLAFIVAALLAALVLANIAAALFAIWQLDPGAAVSAPWAGLFDAPRANDRSDLGAMLSMALFGGSALACLVFAVERVLRLALQQLQRTW